ncbi:MAG: hypothetical protein ABIF71_04665 [Planctomycetota bacterium]
MGERSGVGYAWSKSPRGPFKRQTRPLVLNATVSKKPLLGKYNRLYGTTLIRRPNDWMLLTIMDSGRCHSWGLAAMTAPAPGGPYGEPMPIFHTEDGGHHPPLLEYFSAFVHEGRVYAPATSVALNRNFQVLHRARLEEATDPKAWELVQHGSIWHAEPVEHEAHGLWGQTFSGFVDPAGNLSVMFPSRDKQGFGTINLASRPWNTPFRPSGFHVTGHKGPSLTCVRRGYDAVTIDAEIILNGTATILWGMQGPLGADAVRADASLHALCRTGWHGFECAPSGWRLLPADAAGKVSEAAKGIWTTAPGRLNIRHDADGSLRVRADDIDLWSGKALLRFGPAGLLVESWSAAEVLRFEISGTPRTVSIPFLYTDGLLGAGRPMNEWAEIASPIYRHGVGALHDGPGGRAKWNFHGAGFKLWAARPRVWRNSGRPRRPRTGTHRPARIKRNSQHADMFPHRTDR